MKKKPSNTKKIKKIKKMKKIFDTEADEYEACKLIDASKISAKDLRKLKLTIVENMSDVWFLLRTQKKMGCSNIFLDFKSKSMVVKTSILLKGEGYRVYPCSSADGENDMCLEVEW